MGNKALTTAEIKSTCETLEVRRNELRRMLALQEEVVELERRLLIGKADDVSAARAIAEVVCEVFNLPLGCITSRSREERHVLPRHILFCLVRKLTHSSQFAVSKMFGRDHATISHAELNIRNRCDTSPDFVAQLAMIESMCHERIAALKDGKDQ